ELEGAGGRTARLGSLPAQRFRCAREALPRHVGRHRATSARWIDLPLPQSRTGGLPDALTGRPSDMLTKRAGGVTLRKVSMLMLAGLACLTATLAFQRPFREYPG